MYCTWFRDQNKMLYFVQRSKQRTALCTSRSKQSSVLGAHNKGRRQEDNRDLLRVPNLAHSPCCTLHLAVRRGTHNCTNVPNLAHSPCCTLHLQSTYTNQHTHADINIFFLYIAPTLKGEVRQTKCKYTNVPKLIPVVVVLGNEMDTNQNSNIHGHF